MKKITISGSAKLQDEINNWRDYFKKLEYEILDYPKPIDSKCFMELYPEIHRKYFEQKKCEKIF